MFLGWEITSSRPVFKLTIAVHGCRTLPKFAPRSLGDGELPAAAEAAAETT
jgi:hypothetical protein